MQERSRVDCHLPKAEAMTNKKGGTYPALFDKMAY